MEDIRWVQRLESYIKAYNKLFEATNVINELKIDDPNKNLLKEGLIQRFEFTYELAWNLMKDYCEYFNAVPLQGSRDAIREAFKLQIIDDAHIWLDMHKSRTMSSHTYNENAINDIIEKTIFSYIMAFENLKDKMISLK